MSALLTGVLETRRPAQPNAPPSFPAHYASKLLATLEREAKGPRSSAIGLPEPLTERELDVLRLIAAGKSNRRIASELFVSVGTVKTHTNNLYRKLDAHSRTQALARARELNLL